MPTETFLNLQDEKRNKFIEIAVDEFSAHDYQSASISKIVARAGIAKGSLYQYFKDKRDLYNFLLELAAKKKADYLAGFDLTGPDGDIFETLRLLSRSMLEFEADYPKLAMIGNRAISSSSPLPAELVHQAVMDIRQFFKGLIDQGKNRGEINPVVDSETAAFIIIAALTEMVPFVSEKSVSESKSINRGNVNLGVKAAAAFEQVISLLENGMSMNPTWKKD